MFKKFLLLIIATIMILLATACGENASDTEGQDGNEGDQETLVIYDWGGDVTEAHKEALYDPFEEEYNVEIIVETPVNYGKFKASVESGNVDWDVADLADDRVVDFGNQGLLEELDYEVIDKDRKSISPDSVNSYGLGAERYTTAMAYKTDTFQEDPPQSWADFWDVEKYPGARSLWKYPVETMEIALLADGVPFEELYPIDIDRALKSLDKLRESTEIVWWETNAEPAELLSTGSVVLSSAWNASITSAISEGAPLTIEYNQGIMANESWVVPKGTEKKDLAMKFIDFATNAEQQANFSKIIDYSPVNEKAVDLLSEDIAKKLGQSPELASKQGLLNSEWWADNIDEATKRFEEWLLSE